MQIENLLPQNIFKEINKFITGNYFPWFWQYGTAYADEENTFQFSHTFYLDGKVNSNHINIPQLILEYFEEISGIKIKGIERIKANLLPKQPFTNKDKIIALHKDIVDDNFLSLIYYVIDTDGNTSIYNEDKKTVIEEYQPKANSIVYFKSNYWHGTVPPIINKRRIIINFVLQI